MSMFKCQLEISIYKLKNITKHCMWKTWRKDVVVITVGGILLIQHPP